MADQQSDENVTKDNVSVKSLEPESTSVENRHPDEGVEIADVAVESLKEKGVADKHLDEHLTTDNVSVKSLEPESTAVENLHFSDESVGIADVALESSKAKDVADKQSDEGETSMAGVSVVADKHSDKGERIAEVALESLKPEGGAEKQLDKDEGIAEVDRVVDEHTDKGERIAEVALESLKPEGGAEKQLDKDGIIAEVALESLKPEGGAEKQLDKDEIIAEVARVVDEHTDKGDRIAEVALESLKPEGGAEKQLDKDEVIAEVARVVDEHTDKGDRIVEVALESLKPQGVEDKHSDEGESIAEVSLDSLKSEVVEDKRSDEGKSIAEVSLDSLKSKGVADQHSYEGESVAEVALDALKSKGVADQHSYEGESIPELALDALKSKGVEDKRSDEGESVAEVALDALKSKGVADKRLDEGEHIAEVALDNLKSESVLDKHLDEGAITTNAIGKSSESMASGSTVEINIKTLDSQLHNFIVDKNMLVSTFKETIASEVGLPVDQQRLIFRGKVLKDDDLLSEYYVESGHTLHLVARQPSEFQPSSGFPGMETTARSSNAGQDNNVTGTHPRVGNVSHSVVLGTFGVGEQDEVGSTDINQVIGAVLNFFGQGLIAGTGTTQPHMQFSMPMQVAHGNETGNQSQPRSPGQSIPQGYPIPVGSVPAVPTLATPIPESLHTLSEFMNHMDRALSHNGTGHQPSDSTEGFPSVELPSNAHGLPSLAALAVVLRQAQRLLSGPTVDSLSHTARRLEEAEGSGDVTVRTQIQTEAMQSGLAMQHLGTLLLELGRTMLTLRIGQSPAESSVNAGPAVYISSSGPNPIMVQPFPLQTNSLFGGSFGPVGIGAVPRHLNIHIHPGPRATNVDANRGQHANINAGVSSQTRDIGDNIIGIQSSVRTDVEDTGNATLSRTRMQSLSETEGGSSRRNIPLGLGPGGLQPKRRQRQTRFEAGSSGGSTSSAGGQMDPATTMNQIMQNPALNNLMAGVSNQNGAGSPDLFRNLMSQVTQNPEMMNTVNQFAQHMDGNQDLSSMLAGMGGSSSSGNIDMSSLVQQMMPFVSQALNSGSSSSSSSSNKLQPVPSRKGTLHRRSSSVKSFNTNERSSEFQMNLENAAQKIVEHYPPLEIFSSIVQTVAALRNDVYDTNAINALCMEEELAQEFNEMLKRDISRRLQ